MGDLVITLVLEELGLIPEEITSPPAKIMVTVFDDESYLESLALANQLRSAGLKVSCYPQADKLSKQLKYADRIGINIAVLLGPDEIGKGIVTLKNLSTGDQTTEDRNSAPQKLAEMLEDIDSS
jgi:histidyl-tRNA synthetase